MSVDLRLYFWNKEHFLTASLTEDFSKVLDQMSPFIKAKDLVKYHNIIDNKVYLMVGQHLGLYVFKCRPHNYSKYVKLMRGTSLGASGKFSAPTYLRTWNYRADQFEMAHVFELSDEALALFTLTLPGFTIPEDVKLEDANTRS